MYLLNLQYLDLQAIEGYYNNYKLKLWQILINNKILSFFLKLKFSQWSL